MQSFFGCLLASNHLRYLYLTDKHWFSYLLGGKTETQRGNTRSAALPTELTVTALISTVGSLPAKSSENYSLFYTQGLFFVRDIQLFSYQSSEQECSGTLNGVSCLLEKWKHLQAQYIKNMHWLAIVWC